jgi:hypothetical protein
MYIHTYIHTYIHIRIHPYAAGTSSLIKSSWGCTPAFKCMYVRVYACVYTWEYTCIYRYIHTHINRYLLTHVFACKVCWNAFLHSIVCMYVYGRAYIHMYIHTHIKYTHLFLSSQLKCIRVVISWFLKLSLPEYIKLLLYIHTHTNTHTHTHTYIHTTHQVLRYPQHHQTSC